MSVRVRPASDEDLATFVALRNEVTPDWPASREQVEWSDRVYPGGGRFIAEVDGRPAGAANTGRIHVMPPDYADWWAEVTVVPAARRRGAGTALLTAVSRLAAEADRTGLQVPVSDARPEGAAFLRRFGFEELERSKSVQLRLDATSIPDVALPDGVRLVTLAERPELVADVHGIALAAFDDIPGGDPMAAGDLAEFRARDVDRPGIRPEGFFVALAGDVAIGYASIIVEDARPLVGIHDMTAVLREWRGRGVARALKAATIGWAARAGLEVLETGNDEANAAMRAVNARLGYRPLADLVFFRGPLIHGIDRAP